jgi:hypothetical protein
VLDTKGFGGTCILHLQGSHSACHVLSAGNLLGLFDPECRSDVVLKRRLTFNGPHGIISHYIKCV